MKKYTAYIVKERDPILDLIGGIIHESGLKVSQITENGTSPSTLYSWRKRKTRRPQFATISNVAITCGATGIDFVDGKAEFRLPPRKKLKVVQGGKK
jgi:hypothetical protein